jgi:hypothetical protein
MMMLVDFTISDSQSVNVDPRSYTSLPGGDLVDGLPPAQVARIGPVTSFSARERVACRSKKLRVAHRVPREAFRCGADTADDADSREERSATYAFERSKGRNCT